MKITIYNKMMFGFTIIILLMFVVNGYILIELETVTETTTNVLTYDVQSIDLAKQLQVVLDDQERYVQKYLVAGDTTYYSLFTETAGAFRQTLDSLTHMPGDAWSGILLHAIANDEAAHMRVVTEDSLLWHRSAAVRLLAGEDTSDAVFHMRGNLEELVTLKQRAIAATMTQVGAAASRTFRVAILLALGALLVAIALAFVITRTITRPIKVLVAGTEHIARGAFTHIDVTSRDEIAQLANSFNSMSDSLRRINTFKAEMMQHISHELRMPLQTMHSAYYLLTDEQAGPLTDAQRRLMHSIRENIDKISRFSNQFLDLSKVEAGMMEYDFKCTDVGPIVSAAVENARINAARKEIAINVVSHNVPPAFLDVDKCTQMFDNLLGNAVKYTNAGGTITVTTEPCPLGIRVSVSDTGQGIAPEELKKVFTRFYRAQNAVKGGNKGTGLGLTLVKALVEGHKGTIHATSKLGAGSNFIVELPAAPANGRDVE